ncbi:MAG: hypothetical protein M3R02_26445 [Chloroflexota bacterium]|nr:hypothetical protein [Chloroflexota bacterium]
MRPLTVVLLLSLAFLPAPVHALAQTSTPPGVRPSLAVDGRFPIEGEPLAIVAGPDAVWAATGRQSVVRLDPVTGRVLQNVHLPGQPHALVLGEGALWVLSPDGGGMQEVPVPTAPLPDQGVPDGAWVAVAAVFRIDPGTGVIVATIPVGRPGGGIAVAAGSVWVGGQGEAGEPGTLIQIDPATNAVASTIPVGPADGVVRDVAGGPGSVWALVPCVTCPAPNHAIHVDSAQQTVIATHVLGGVLLAQSIAAVDGVAWVTGIGLVGRDPQAVQLRVDARTGEVVEEHRDGLPLEITANTTGLWESDCLAATVMAVDPGTGQPIGEPILVGEPAPPGFDPWTESTDGLSCPGRPAVGEGVLWVPVPGDAVVVRVRIVG